MANSDKELIDHLKRITQQIDELALMCNDSSIAIELRIIRDEIEIAVSQKYNITDVITDDMLREFTYTPSNTRVVMSKIEGSIVAA